MMKRIMLTTEDNPYDPFENFEEWLMFDKTQGYHTCERLDRIAYTSDQLSDSENENAIEEAMNELIKYGAINNNGELIEYKKVESEN